jgi:hypothetical protein
VLAQSRARARALAAAAAPGAGGGAPWRRALVVGDGGSGLRFAGTAPRPEAGLRAPARRTPDQQPLEPFTARWSAAGWEASSVAALFPEGAALRGAAAAEEEIRWPRGGPVDLLHVAAHAHSAASADRCAAPRPAPRAPRPAPELPPRRCVGPGLGLIRAAAATPPRARRETFTLSPSAVSAAVRNGQ